MKTTKVLMVGNNPSVKGGISSVITQLMEHDWAAQGITMKFIPTYIETDTIRKIAYFIQAYQKIKKELKTRKPDVVHIHMSYKGSFIRKYRIHRLCLKYNVPDIIHLHGSEFKKWYDECADKRKHQIEKMLRESAAFIVLGEKWNKVIKEIEPRTNTIVVSNTVHIPEEKCEWQSEITILFLGVLIKRKGVSDLLRAVKMLKEKQEGKRFKVIIAGTGEEEQKLKDEAKLLAIDDIVEFAGWTEGKKKKELLRKSQILVLPSYNEGLPIAILEAISYGLPVIATDVGDISSAVIDGKNGYLIQPGDIDALENGLERLMQDKEQFLKMSAYARHLCEEKFSDTKYFEQIGECYKKEVAVK